MRKEKEKGTKGNVFQRANGYVKEGKVYQGSQTSSSIVHHGIYTTLWRPKIGCLDREQFQDDMLIAYPRSITPSVSPASGGSA
jgi:hypothetical protein